MTTTADTTRTEWASPRDVQPKADVLVTPAWLAEHVSDPNVRVIEVDVSATAYHDWHIAGAVLWNVYCDLKDADYRLVDLPALERLLTRSGIGPESTVVFYGYAPAIGLWLMKLLGHTDARILDCSRETWRAAGHPCSSATPDPGERTYSLSAGDGRLRADHIEVLAAIDDPGSRLVDVRSAEEYRGERFWPSGALEPNGRAGHVPSAVHQPIDDIYDERGAFRTPDELRERFAAVGLDSDAELIVYCAVGGRAATAWFVLTQLLGRDNVRVYDGSWAEWGRMVDTPVVAS